MQIIEYFNFKNKPLSKEEKTIIKNQIDEFMIHFNNISQDIDNPLLNHDDNHLRFDLKSLCTEIVTKGIGKVIYTSINGTFSYAIFIDIGQCFNQESENSMVLNTLKSIAKFKPSNRKNKKVLFDSLTENYWKELKYLKKDIYDICPTTCLFISNLKFENWFINGSPIKAILDAFPCYNLLALTSEEINQEQIDTSNKTRTYKFSSKCKADMNVWYFNKVFEMYQSNLNSDYHYYNICRYPELLEVYDDYRNKTIPMIFPIDNPLEKNSKYQGTGIKVILRGFDVIKESHNYYFTSKINNEVEAILYPKVDYNTFFDIETSFDLFHVHEGLRVYNIDGISYQALFFYSFGISEDYLFIKEKHKSTKKSISEDKMVADIYTTMPVRYEDIKKLFDARTIENNFVVKNLITGLRFQENYEFGNENHNVRKYQERIIRFDLGTVNMLIREEPHYNYYQKDKVVIAIKRPIPIRLMVTADIDTHSAVLYLLNYGCKHKPSYYLNEVSTNGIILQPNEQDLTSGDFDVRHSEDGIPYISFYTYIKKRFGLNKMGTPRHLILSPFLGDCPEDASEAIKTSYKEIKSSLLYARTLFEDAEELGKIVDEHLDIIYRKKWGDAIFDYSTTYITKTTVLQYADTYKDYLAERIDFAVVTLFYFEVLQLEDSAIQIATNNISKFIDTYQIETRKTSKNKKKVSSENALNIIEDIYEEYAKTMDLWDVEMNLFSSNRFISTMRRKFEIQKDIDKLNRNRKGIEQIYQGKQGNIQKRNSLLIGAASLILTISGGVDVIRTILKTFSDKLPKWLNYTTIDKYLMFIIVCISVFGVLLFFLIRAIIRKHDKTIIKK